LVLAADGVEITTVSVLNSLVHTKSVGETMELIIYRGREQITVVVSIVEQIPETLKPAA
jgi:S1-C subfamily serine protease